MDRIDRPTVVHVRLNGFSQELPLALLNLSPAAEDAQVKAAVARHLDRPSDALERHVVVRTREAIILRPEALYG
jgi:hypothetical protein